MKKYFILAVAVSMFTACTNNEEMVQDIPIGKIPLNLSTTYNLNEPIVTTRGTDVAYQSTAVVTTNVIGIYIRKHGSVAAKVATDTYEVDNVASSTLSPQTYSSTACVDVTPSSNIFYPDQKTQPIDIYAYAPTSIMTSTHTTIDAFAIDLSSVKDQGDATGYLANDILWGKQGDAASATNEISASKYATVKASSSAAGTETGAYIGTGSDVKVKIPMTHKGSKIVVNLSASGMDASKLDGAKVEFMVDYTKGSFNLANGTITTYTGVASQNFSQAQHITMTPSTGLTNAHSCAAVILPQYINAQETDNTAVANPNNTNTNYELIRITLSDGSTVYSYFINSIKQFQSGYVYTYAITVTASGLNITTTVADWGTETGSGAYTGDPSGTATLQ